MDGTVKVEAQTSAPDGSAAKPTKKKGRVAKLARNISQTAFPYSDLESAIGVARALLEAGGVPLTRDQLAGAMKQTPGSGSFAWKVGASRLFGLVEQRDNKNQLTDLGFAITEADDARQKEARAQAFLAVPLYRRVYDEFKGKPLPPRPTGLEAAFVSFGVAPKQKDKARHAFERSAKQAGFFDHGNERLVEPIIASGTISVSDTATVGESPMIDRPPQRMQGGPRRGYHPFIEGLLETLPPPQTMWSDNERAKWLRAAQDIFELIYKKDAEDKAPKPVRLIIDEAITRAASQKENE